MVDNFNETVWRGDLLVPMSDLPEEQVPETCGPALSLICVVNPGKLISNSGNLNLRTGSDELQNWGLY